MIVARGSCTDPTWQSSGCPNYCSGESSNEGLWLTNFTVPEGNLILRADQQSSLAPTVTVTSTETVATTILDITSVPLTIVETTSLSGSGLETTIAPTTLIETTTLSGSIIVTTFVPTISAGVTQTVVLQVAATGSTSCPSSATEGSVVNTGISDKTLIGVAIGIAIPAIILIVFLFWLLVREKKQHQKVATQLRQRDWESGAMNSSSPAMTSRITSPFDGSVDRNSYGGTTAAYGGAKRRELDARNALLRQNN
ncbi:hypothetical protein MMC25_005897 [Agyrium rufum]|nr:hypothetical protein [Agyrium rufum]